MTRGALRRLLCCVALGVLPSSVTAGRLATPRGAPRTQHVVLIVIDGLRWQEVFTGADSSIIFGQPQYTGDSTDTRKQFWRATADERRSALLPFMWSTVAREGQIFGNVARGSRMRVTNGVNVSYPGYAEMLAGFADPRIRSNGFGRNPNETVFDWIAAKPSHVGRVAAFGTWTTFGDIFNRDRAHFPIHAGWSPPIVIPETSLDSLLNRMYLTSRREWHDVAFDALMQAAVLHHLRDHRPHLLFVGYGETDEWAHAGRYRNVLESARAADAYIAELWNTLQAIPEYRGTTTFLITTDHGRGSRDREWREHGEKIAGAQDVWLAVMGPDTPPLGERTNSEPITQSQIAATIAALLGEDYAAAVPRAAAPLRW